MTTRYETFSEWLERELNSRGWRPSDLARIAKIDTGLLSRIMSNQRGAGNSTCVAIARAFNLPPEAVLRKAGRLPPSRDELVDADPQLGEAHNILDQLDRSRLDTVLTMLRGLVNAPPLQYSQPRSARTAPALTDQHVVYGGNTTPAIEQTFYQLPKSFQEIIVDQINRLAVLANAEMLEKIAREADLMGGHNEDTNATQSRPVDASVHSLASITGDIDQ